MKQITIHPFPSGAESNGFIAALSSALLPCLGIAEETPYWCALNSSFCTDCGGCSRTNLTKHQEMLYHILLAVSGLAFTFDYPEDDDVGFHTMPDTPIGWRWDEPFMADLMDFAGLSYIRYTGKSIPELREILCRSINSGYTALCADTRNISENGAWSRCWNVVCGYTEDSILVMHHGGEIVTETDGTYSAWIVITGKAERKQTYRDVLKRIYTILTDPSHDALEQEIYADLSNVTEENAVGLAYKMMGINGVPIETRWHAAEAFCSSENLLSSLMEDTAVKQKLSSLFFDRYIANDNNETHGTGWKIWSALHVGPETGYMPTEESFMLIQQPEVQAEMKRLWRIVFDNDRAVEDGIRKVLEKTDSKGDKNMNELREILEKFAVCGWDLIDKPSRDWLNGKENRAELIAAIKEADKQCGFCGCEFDPLYKRALELLINEMVIETPRLILRRFTAEDWSDLLEIARSKEASPYAYTDFTWPTDENWAKESAAYMATDSDMWAMARQDDGKVVCFINCNGMNDAGYMDIGHVMNMAYAGQGYAEEGLAALYRYVFDTTDAVGITAGWALEDKEKITPLLSMGMEIVGQDTGNAFDGSGRTFTHCILQITKEQWIKRTGQEETE